MMPYSEIVREKGIAYKNRTALDIVSARADHGAL